MSAVDNAPSGPTLPPLLARLDQRRKPLGYALCGAAALLATVTVLLAVRYRLEYLTIAIWTATMALTLAGAGMGILLGSFDPGKREGPSVSGLVLVAGGLVGFQTWLLALVLAYQWRATVFGGLEAWQGNDWWRLWVVILTMLAGLVVMFLSLLPARSVERTNPQLRRLLYGYNAFLGGLLLLAILLVANVLAYNYFTTSWDWTASGIYSLSEGSPEVLKSLKKPTRIYAIVRSSEDFLFGEVRNLLDNARAVNDRIYVKYLSPDLNPDQVLELQREYQLPDALGLLVVYGEKPDVQHQFIKETELFGTDPDARTARRASFIFKGEDALISALKALEEGKTKPTVYFTQGNGELDLKNFDSLSREGGGIGLLRERLEKGNYLVKGLQFVPTAGTSSPDPLLVASNRVPDDADVVVVAGPRVPLPDFAVKALRDYLTRGEEADKKKGKLVLLLDLVLDSNRNPVSTGLEALAAEYGIRVTNERILSLPTNLNRGNVLQILVMAGRNANNPLTQAFHRQIFPMSDVRAVRVDTERPNTPLNRFQAEPLFLAYQYAWAESNLRTPADQLVEELLKDENAAELNKKLNQAPAPVAVAALETAPPDPGDPHAGFRGGERKPRLVVFGSSSFVTNRNMGERGPDYGYTLLSGTLAWLRDKPPTMGLQPKRRNLYELNPDPDQLTRMYWLPFVLMSLGVIGMGTAVWVVRRR